MQPYNTARIPKPHARITGSELPVVTNTVVVNTAITGCDKYDISLLLELPVQNR